MPLGRWKGTLAMRFPDETQVLLKRDSLSASRNIPIISSGGRIRAQDYVTHIRRGIWWAVSR